MPFFEWEKSFEVGVKQFDEHHMHLAELLNATFDDFSSGANHETIGAVLDKLIDYATYHFTAEEQWMNLNGYDGYLLHCEEHNMFSRRVVEIQNDFHLGNTRLSLEVLTLLKNWLLDHILKTDAAYGCFAAGISHGIME